MEYCLADRPEVRIHARDLGLACCAAEFAAAVGQGLLRPIDPTGEAGGAGTRHILVISGTVTEVLHDEIRAAWDELPEPRAALAFGACSTSGGPYWDSYAVTPGVDEVIPVQWYVPGCPPRPAALVEALAELAGAG